MTHRYLDLAALRSGVKPAKVIPPARPAEFDAAMEQLSQNDRDAVLLYEERVLDALDSDE